VFHAPDLTFSFMCPLVGLMVLLKNPLVREQIKFEESQLNDEEKAAGHFLCGDIAKEARAHLPVVPVGRPVLPLYLGWWSDSTNVSFGGMVCTWIFHKYTHNAIWLGSLNGACASIAAVGV